MDADFVGMGADGPFISAALSSWSDASPRPTSCQAEDRLVCRFARVGKTAEMDPDSISASIETGALDDESMQSGGVDGVTVMEIYGRNRLAVQAGVEESFRVFQLGPFWKRQPHRVLEGLAYADDAVVGPDWHPLGPGGFLPLHLFDYAEVGAPDQSPQLAQPLTPPAGGLPDDGIDLLGRGCVVHADALPRRLNTQRTEGLPSFSFPCAQPSRQHGRRFPSR